MGDTCTVLPLDPQPLAAWHQLHMIRQQQHAQSFRTPNDLRKPGSSIANSRQGTGTLEVLSFAGPLIETAAAAGIQEECNIYRPHDKRSDRADVQIHHTHDLGISCRHLANPTPTRALLAAVTCVEPHELTATAHALAFTTPYNLPHESSTVQETRNHPSKHLHPRSPTFAPTTLPATQTSHCSSN